MKITIKDVLRIILVLSCVTTTQTWTKVINTKSLQDPDDRPQRLHVTRTLKATENLESRLEIKNKIESPLSTVTALATCYFLIKNNTTYSQLGIKNALALATKAIAETTQRKIEEDNNPDFFQKMSTNEFGLYLGANSLSKGIRDGMLISSLIGSAQLLYDCLS